MKKKEISNFVVYLFIFLLTMIIAIPPLFRTFIPKKDTSLEQTKRKAKIVLLTCNKTSDDGLYQIDAKTKFKDGNVTNVTISYSTIDMNTTNTPQTPSVDPNMPGDNNTSVNGAISDPNVDFFRSLMDVTIQEEATQFTVEMTPSVLKENSDIPEIHNYFNLLPNQRKYYEGLGYTCTKIES